MSAASLYPVRPEVAANTLTDHFKLGPNVDVNYMIHTQAL